MPGAFDIQITIAQQTSTAYQQQLYQQQPIVHQQYIAQTNIKEAREEETQVQGLEKGGQGIKIEEKRGNPRYIKKRRQAKKEEEKKEEIVSNGIRGKIIDVIG